MINVVRGFRRSRRLFAELKAHFAQKDLTQLSVATREFPVRVRADLQRASETLFEPPDRVCKFFSIRQQQQFAELTFAEVMSPGWMPPAVISPPEYEEIDIGEEQPVRCLKAGLWLTERNGIPYAVLMSPAGHHGMVTGVSFQIATQSNEASVDVAESVFRKLETSVQQGRCYRGKILSLEMQHSYTGQSTGIKVHKLPSVTREQVILSDKTIALLDRNIIQFVKQRSQLSARGQATRKGLLFYGPPGTGKSHTIRYLAGALAGHTALLITAEQVGLLAEYMALARLLQPSVVIIEDVDLIARDRQTMNNICEEAMLNKLLNEMDGLKEEADVLFILTTNRPESLEAALASRPGRVDQAIEFPLPDESCREKLVKLYSGTANVSDDLTKLIVSRTEKVSAAFIKELLRRSVQFQLERQAADGLIQGDVENALDEMLFAGGSLNVKLLGGNVAN